MKVLMAGIHNKLAAKLKRDIGLVFVIECLAQRLAIASSDAVGGVDYIGTYTTTL